MLSSSPVEFNVVQKADSVIEDKRLVKLVRAYLQ
jgi:hypothetical protein